MTIVTGTVLAIMKNNRILLIKRNKEPFKGLWALPGGKIEYGEHIEECALRECKEETGLDGKFSGICGIVNEHVMERESVAAHFLLFVCRIEPEGTDYIEGREGELKWFDINSLDETGGIVPSDERMIRDIIIANKGYAFKSVVKKEEERYIQSVFEAI